MTPMYMFKNDNMLTFMFVILKYRVDPSINGFSGWIKPSLHNIDKFSQPMYFAAFL